MPISYLHCTNQNNDKFIYCNYNAAIHLECLAPNISPDKTITNDALKYTLTLLSSFFFFQM